MNDIHPLLSEEAVSDLVGKSIKTLARWRREGAGPAFVRIGKTPRYRGNDVMVWMLANRMEPHPNGAPITD